MSATSDRSDVAPVGEADLPVGVPVQVRTLDNGGKATITRESEFDRLGRCMFILDWVQDGKPRGQVFFAVPSKYVKLERRSKWKRSG